jgi:bifunctional UDP-N-acetylglucosamine pyrophosphorylase / glucosamine-1-phosphate N-acetyltransferase
VSESHPAAVILLAAGEGTRMKSRTPKMLHSLCGRSLVGHALVATATLEPQHLILVIGHARHEVTAEAASLVPAVQSVVQEQQNGTGHAVRTALEAVGTIPGTVLVTYGDMPLLRAETLRGLARIHEDAGNSVTVLTAHATDPRGYGRIIRDHDGSFIGIVEDADADETQRGISEINSGCYAFDGELLADAVKQVASNNALNQEYLTDVVDILRGDGHRVGAVIASDPTEIQGVNDRVQLATARRVLNDRLAESHMRNGVTIVDPATTYLDVGVTIGQDTELAPGTVLEGETVIGEGVRIGPGCTLTDTSVGDGAYLRHTVADQAEIGKHVTVGPYAYLRPGTRIADQAHIGCHVELKNAVVGEGAKVPHLTYVGDADIGTGANVGAGTIFANYDGVRKHHTTVGERAFVGSNSVLIAPVTIGDGAYTAAGSAISEDVPPGDLGIARGRQHNSEGWVLRHRAGTASAEAASRVVKNEEG